MNYYSAISEERLLTCHHNIQRVFRSVLKDYDHSIAFGYRSKELQHELYTRGRTLVNGIWQITNPALVVTNCDGDIKQSRHNHVNSEGEPEATAIDVYPYFDGKMQTDERNLIYFAGKVMERARALGIPLTWGGDWDGDYDTTDNKLMDAVHYELKGVV
jgi:peptidoglycan L-alanyl-D-glutamate endopeptidase CwlK